MDSMECLKFPILEIRSGRYDNLSVSLDTGEIEYPHPVFLYHPDTTVFDHFHIEITREAAEQLRDWLDTYLHTSVK